MLKSSNCAHSYTRKLLSQAVTGKITPMPRSEEKWLLLRQAKIQAYSVVGRVAAFGRSYMNNSLLFRKTIGKTRGTMLLVPKTIATVTLEDK